MFVANKMKYLFRSLLGVISFLKCVDDDEDEAPQFNRRGERKLKKRKKKPHTWKKNVAKVRRNYGESYVSNGILRPAKELQPPCGPQCRIKCSEKFTLEQRQQILRDYWNLEDLTKKREFIIKNMEQIIPKYLKKKEGSKRSLNYAYNFFWCGEKVKVCSTFFLNTLAISYMTVQTALKKFYREKHGLVEGEQRGKHKRKLEIKQETST